jgi:hypothetical protein
MTQAQTTKLDAQTVPSARTAGAPGNKNGPAAKPETTTGSTAPQDSTVQQQDPSNVKGLPGGKSGPAVKQPERR